MDTASMGNLLEVNGAKIYHEVRGSGPSVLFVAGATGDGGHFERVAEILSEEFTVVTYDRRANSRSPRPDGSLRQISGGDAAVWRRKTSRSPDLETSTPEFTPPAMMRLGRWESSGIE